LISPVPAVTGRPMQALAILFMQAGERIDLRPDIGQYGRSRLNGELLNSKVDKRGRISYK